jgi:hypothetical protein
LLSLNVYGQVSSKILLIDQNIQVSSDTDKRRAFL